MPKIVMRDVIVLIPGIMGSVLKKNNKILWGYSFSRLIDTLICRGDNFADDLALRDFDDPDIANFDDVVADELMPDLHLIPGYWKIDGYSSTRDFINRTFDVTLGRNYFELPYDWRRNNIVAAKKLNTCARRWLDNWKTYSGNNDARLILIAHSMGGLVSRYFLECLGGWEITKALITFGTPYQGSLNAVDALSNGIHKFRFINLTDFVRQTTSIYQLLPTYPCYDPGDGAYVRIQERVDIPNIDSRKAIDAIAFHKAILDSQTTNTENTDYRSPSRCYRTYAAVGVRQETFLSAMQNGNSVSMLSTYGSDDPIYLTGDGTVPQISAMPTEVNPHAMYAATRHGSLQTAATVLVNLIGIVTSLTYRPPTFKSTFSGTARVTLKVEDFFCKNEKIVIRAMPSVKADLRATISGPDNKFLSFDMELESNGWHKLSIDRLPPADYRVAIEGINVEPASDSFSVINVER